MPRPVLLLLTLAACAAPLPAPITAGAPFQLPLRLVGTEPFWGARVDGRTVVLNGADRKTLTARIVRSKFSASGGAYAAEAREGEAFTAMTVSFDPEPCSDGMSDRTYPLKATVIIGRDPDRSVETLRGCAITEAEFVRQ